MGEGKKRPLRLDFDPRLRLDLNGARVLSDRRLVGRRELDEIISLTAQANAVLFGSRLSGNKRHSLATFLRKADAHGADPCGPAQEPALAGYLNKNIKRFFRGNSAGRESGGVI